MSEMTQFLLQTFCSAMVPLTILELQKRGGPDETMFERVREDHAHYIAEHGDAILYRTRDTHTAVAKLVEGLAVLAFCPGGVDFLGMHFEAQAAGESEVDV